jgi:SAM-dependent methyltransferase
MASVPTGMASTSNTAPVLFDRALLRARQRRALRGAPATFLLDRVVEDMVDRLQAVTRDFSDVADIWTPNAAAREALRARFASIRHIGVEDAEVLPLQPESLDLAVSALAFQFVNDLPGVLAQIRRALRPDGLLLAAMIGGDTLTELRQSFAEAEAECEGGVSPRVAPLHSGALRQRLCADAGLAAHGRHQRHDRAAPRADPPCHHDADGANLCATLCRSRWPHPRHLRHHLAVGLGAA